MAAPSMFRRAVQVAAVAFVSGVIAASLLAAGPAMLPPARLEASTAAPVSDSGVADSGAIAYVDRLTNNIRVINADGTNDHLLWTNPDPTDAPLNLAWRHDGAELAFSSRHESSCSFYDSDVYAIRSDGTGLRRVTNAPTCAELAPVPKGAVTVEVWDYTGGAFVYVAGAPGVKAARVGDMLFENVADFGPGVLQPAIGIVGLDRVTSDPPFADVVVGETKPGGVLTIDNDEKIRGFGAGAPSWQADNAKIAYALRICSEMDLIAAAPGYGQQGTPLPLATNASPCIVDLNPVPAQQQEYVYYSSAVESDDAYGIYWVRPGGPTGGENLLMPRFWASGVIDLKWLPDGSGYVYNETVMASWDWETCGEETYGTCNNIYRYDFATNHLSQVTDFSGQKLNLLSVSPDSQHIVYEWWHNPDIDEGSDLWILDLNTHQTHLLKADAGRPAWGPTGTAPAVAPTVGIKLEGRNVKLNWTDDAANTGGYKVRYSEKPYFQVGDAGVTTVDLPKGSTGWTHTNGAGDPNHNYYYFVQGVGTGGATSGPSNRTGGFNFGLTRGS